MISSVDNSYKREKELLYTINEYITTTYVGRAVREEELLRSFDSVSDERLDMMKHNTDSRDYIFCPHCERKLGDYLVRSHIHLWKKQRPGENQEHTPLHSLFDIEDWRKT